MKSSFLTISSRMLLAAVSISGVLATPALAQSNNSRNQTTYSATPNSANTTTPISSLSGLYLQAGVGFQSVSPSFSSLSYSIPGYPNYNSTPSVNSSQSLSGTITAGVNMPVTSSLLLGIGAEISPIAGKSTSFGGGTVLGVNIPSSTYQTKTSYNYFISPIIPMADQGALYGKIGYSQMQLSAGPNATSANYSGYSLGAGYKAFVSGNIYAYFEGNYFSYGNTTISGSATIPSTGTRYTYSSTSSATAFNLLYGFGMQF